MSPDGISLSSFPPSQVATLQDVLETIQDGSLPKATKRNLISALTAIAKVSGKPLYQLPVSADRIRDLLDRQDWGAMGFSKRNWSNIRSSVKRAIKIAGFDVDHPKDRPPLTSEWQVLIDGIEGVQAKCGLKRLGHFCSGRQLNPRDVSDRTIEDFLIHLDEREISKAPEQVVRTTIAQWNRHVAPSLEVKRLRTRGRRDFYIKPWPAFPGSLEADAIAYRAMTTSGNILDRERCAVRQSTADKRHRMIRQFASAVVMAGEDATELSDLKSLFTAHRIKQGLTYLMGRNDDKPNQQAFDMACLGKTVGESWCGMDQADTDLLSSWCKKLKPKKRGLTDKNRERLAPFADQKVMQKFLDLPNRLLARAASMDSGPRAAMLVQKALAIKILQHAPLRIMNLSQLHLDRHFVSQITGSKASKVLRIAAEEVKNHVDLTFPLPDDVRTLLELYRNDYLPLLGDPDQAFLFPGRTGPFKSENAMRHMIMGTIERELGLIMNPHLFRHLCAQIILTANPGQYETVRRMLGHRSLQTTINAYVGLEMAAASEQYNGVLAKLSGKDKS